LKCFARRFDEIFFVDLQQEAARSLRHPSPQTPRSAKFDLNAGAPSSSLSSAEISAVVSSLFDAYENINLDRR
jgi:hypothetical protein